MKSLRLMGLLAGTCLLSTVAFAEPAGLPAPVISKCQTCHGAAGDSTSGAVPRLNGQRAGYIAKRLNDFLNVASEDPHSMKAMWPVVSEVSNDTFAAIGRYYASQSPTDSHPAGPLAAAGRSIYASGIAAQEIKSCQMCHGSQGEGSETAPRLAGQHAEYLTSQLQRLRLFTRASDPMFHNARTMTDEQIRALVAYLATN